MNITFQTVKGTFHGLYEWGRGWNRDTAEKWDAAWHRACADSTFWHRHRCGDNEYLTGTMGNIFLHPMDFSAVLNDIGCNTAETPHFEHHIKELHDLCTKVAEECGGSFTMETSEEKTADSGTMRIYEP